MSRRLASAAGYVLALAAYIPAAVWLAWQTRHRINPDAIAYIQIARHWAAGQWDLAVNGWFGPALSWLLVPAVWLHVEPVLALRFYGVALGVAFAAGAASLTRAITCGRYGAYAFAAGLALAVAAVGDEITPDLLLAAGLTWYFAVSIRLVEAPTIRRGLAAGLLAGACFMIKAYALPLAAAHLAMTFVWRRLVRRRRASGDSVGWAGLPTAPNAAPEMVGKPAHPTGTQGGRWTFAIAYAAMIAAVLPWAVVISVQAGHVCISTTGCSAASWGPLEVDGPLPVHRIQLPRNGRITGWENPVEIPYRWPTWRGLGVGEIEGRLKIAAINAGQIGGSLYSMDKLSLLLAGLAAAAVLAFAIRRTFRTPHAAMRTWALLSALIYMGGLLPLWVFDRLLWPVWGLAIAIAFSLSHGAALRLGSRPEAWALQRLGGLLLVASIAAGSVDAIRHTHLPAGAHGEFLRHVAMEIGPHQRVAANQWYGGLFCSYWADAVYLGQPLSSQPGDACAEISQFGPPIFVVFGDEDLAQRLAKCFVTQEIPALSPVTGERAWLVDCRSGTWK